MHTQANTALPKLPGMLIRSLFTVARDDQATASATTINGQFVAPAFTAEQLKNFHDAFGGFIGEVPLTLMYCLAQRVHLAQMLDPEFPWPAPGLVHVSNALEQHAEIDASTEFVMHAAIKLPARGPKVSPRRLRPLFTVQFYQNNELVVTCISEYQVMPKNAPKSAKPREAKTASMPGEDWQHVDSWRLNVQTARQYARLSGDFNPIHLHPFLSRWFGFQQPIIHGMYMAARAQAEIERSAQRAVKTIDVTFKRPVPLPARVSLWQQPTDTQQLGRYQICGAEDHLQRLEGSFSF
ncbi:MAG TPA: MaoC/PaaZ C-terminal domain-containing protein [Pseudidiomarina sp.]|nr:MaoC/PaaZ C-terminal domain-containing protein [Pseudidiomarina sp.]